MTILLAENDLRAACAEKIVSLAVIDNAIIVNLIEPESSFGISCKSEKEAKELLARLAQKLAEPDPGLIRVDAILATIRPTSGGGKSKIGRFD